MVDPFKPSKVERFRQNLSLVLLLLGLAATVIWGFSMHQSSAREEGQREVHTVTGFFVTADYGSGAPLVRTVDQQGHEFTGRTTAEIGMSCKVGDKIKVERKGLSIKLLPDPCNETEKQDAN